MIVAIARHEFRGILRTGRFVAFAVTTLLVALLIVAVRVSLYREVSAAYELTRAEQERRVRETLSLNWPEYSVYSRPPGLAILIEGLPWQGAFDGLSYSAPGDPNPFEVLFAKLDFTWVVGIVMGLFALTLAHDAVSAERERGTLKMLLSQPIQTHHIVIGKWLAGMLAMSLVLMPTVLLGTAGLSGSVSYSERTQTVLTILAVSATSLLYLSALYLFGLGVSSIVDSSATALWILFSTWIGMTFVVPNVSPDLARSILNSPSLMDFYAQRREIEERFRESWLEDLDALKREATDGTDDPVFRALVASVSDGVPGKMNAMQRSVEQAEEVLRVAARREISLSQRLSALSPYACYAYCITDVSGTGIYAQEVFSRRAGMWADEFRDWYFAQYRRFMLTGRFDRFEEPLSVQDLPVFEEQNIPFSEAASVASTFAACLVLQNTFGLAFALFFFPTTGNRRSRRLFGSGSRNGCIPGIGVDAT